MAIVRELLDHFAGSARYVSTDCGLEDHGLADLEFVRRHSQRIGYGLRLGEAVKRQRAFVQSTRRVAPEICGYVRQLILLAIFDQ